ncbi:MAG: DUF4116 domain-containing protein [Chlamydiales bacterium]|nr:DUF4116 domain-containing protein [Chlamydiales bacterium]
MNYLNNHLSSSAVNYNLYNLANQEFGLSEEEADFLALVRLYPLKLRVAPGSFKNHPAIVLAAVQKNGRTLRFASDAMQDHEAIVFAAVQQNGEALCFASERLQNDEDFQAIAQDPAGSNLLPIQFIQFDDFNRDPLSVLLALEEKIISCHTFPKIRYFNSPGLDHGGLSKDCITRLFAEMFDSQNTRLPVKTKLNKERFTPIIKNSLSADCYRAIGTVFAVVLCYEGMLTTGSYLHPVVFEMIHALSHQDILSLPFDLAAYNQIPKEIISKILPIYAKNAIGISEEWIQNILNGEFNEGLQSCGVTSMDDFNLQYSFDQVLLAILMIAKSMHNSTPVDQTWDVWKTASAKDLSLNIEGSLSCGAVLNAIRLQNGHSQTQGFLLEWIINALRKELEEFVWAMSGSKTITPGDHLIISFYEESNALPTFHACKPSTMNLPNGYGRYRVFKDKLERGIKEALLAGFGFI